MSTDESIDREMEQTLRDYYAARSRELQAPADTWARLERRLERPRRLELVCLETCGNCTNGRSGHNGTVAAAVLVIRCYQRASDLTSSTAHVHDARSDARRPVDGPQG